MVKTLTTTIPDVSTLTDQLSNLLCALGVVGYAYRTTYYPSGGGTPVVRYYRAAALAPALLDVKGDGLPDLMASVTPSLSLGIPGLALDVSRIDGFPASGKVKVEAVFLDPVSPTTWVGIGADGSADGLASNWRVTVDQGKVMTSDCTLSGDILSDSSIVADTDDGYDHYHLQDSPVCN